MSVGKKLKVGLVSSFSWTSSWGINRHISGLASALAGRGHDVTVIAPAEEREELRTARRRARAVKDQSSGAASLQAAAGPVAAYRLLRVTGTFRVPYSASLANLTLPLEVTDQLDQLLAREQFDILHLHEPYPPSLSFTALRMAHCPVVASFHAAGERFFSYQLLRPVVERFFARLDGRICTSEHTRRVVSSYFPGDYEVIGSGADLATFHPRAEAKAGDPLMIFAAWGEPKRSLNLLMRAMRLLPEDLHPFALAIADGGELRRGNLVVPRKLRHLVSFQGNLEPGQLAECYQRADLLCAPYATSGSATALLEAMAAGVAVMVPAQGGLKELVREGKEGLILDHPYSFNIAANLVDLLTNDKQRRKMGVAAATRAEHYAWEKIAGAVERSYGRVYQRRRRVLPSASALQSVSSSKTIFADLHIHTCYSHDCTTTPAELLAACDEIGLEAIAVTDHNAIEGAFEVARLAPDHIQVIIGEEIKTTEGEIIGLYLKELIPKGLSAEETIKRIKDQGGLVYVPHPFDPLHLTPTYQLLARNAAAIDIVEVYNPRITFTSFNEKARRLARKYDIPGGAGSDSHVVQGLGTAMLSLRKFSSPAELLASLRGADIIRSNKSPIYLHSLKLLKGNRRDSVVTK